MRAKLARSVLPKIIVVVMTALMLGAQGCYIQPDPIADANDTLGLAPERSRAEILDAQDRPVPGTVDRLYIEPMYDQVRVPAKLDPNGIFYRPSHQTIVEIRQERFQKVEYPDDKK